MEEGVANGVWTIEEIVDLLVLLMALFAVWGARHDHLAALSS
jgi:hypothetical protein